MSVLLTHSYFLYDDDKESRIMKPYPPLGLLYISGYLEQHGLNNKVFDTTFSSTVKQLQFIEKQQPKIIGIYTNLMTKINVIKLVKLLKKESKYGFPKVILGGPDITYNCENYLNTSADFLIIGEGEETMFELCSALLTNNNYHNISGIAYLKDGRVIKTEERGKMKDLEYLPLPNRNAIDFQPYLETWKTYHGKSSMTISTQRGCPYTCKWCSTAVYGLSYRRRPAKQVVDEIKMLIEDYNPDALWFVDDVFTVSHKWLGEFHQEMTKNKLKIPFEIITRAERLNDEVLKQLKEIGCFRIWIGAESGSQKVIDAMDRRVDVETVKEMIQKTNAYGMESGTFIMLGYPGETENDIKATIQYLKEANPTYYTITVAYPIKGTSLYNDIENKITEQPNWETSTDREIDFKRTYKRNYYKYAVRKVVNEVELHRSKSISITKKLKVAYASLAMKLVKTLLLFSILFMFSCENHSYSDLVDVDTTLNLKWNKAYSDDTLEKSLTGLKWGLSYLGAILPSNGLGISTSNEIIILDIIKLGFNSNAESKMLQLAQIIKNSSEYQSMNSVDLGRFITLILGASEHYYEMVETPEILDLVINNYSLLPETGYVNNSSVALEHRIINFSNQTGLNQLFVSKEIDSITGEIYEFETIELLSNGHLRFGIYDAFGIRVPAANSSHTNAGKPAKCMWCHESTINPLFNPQNNYEGYLTSAELQNTLLNYRSSHFNNRQSLLPNGVDFSQTQEHTLTELLYISFMEPSAERLSYEWNLSLEEVETLTSGIQTHIHEEFPFLGNLFYREEIKELAPFEGLEVSSSVREESEIEVNHLN